MKIRVVLDPAGDVGKGVKVVDIVVWMPKAPRLTARPVVAVLRGRGFELAPGVALHPTTRGSSPDRPAPMSFRRVETANKAVHRARRVAESGRWTP